jgi:hypothetical protein
MGFIIVFCGEFIEQPQHRDWQNDQLPWIAIARATVWIV